MNPVVVEFVNGNLWRVNEDYYWHDIFVPAGFLTDFASTPRFIWFWLPPSGEYAPAAVIHDFIYAFNEVPFLSPTKILSRKEADSLFLEAMKELNVMKIRRKLMYKAVRFFGRRIWNKYRKKTKEELIEEKFSTPEESLRNLKKEP